MSNQMKVLLQLWQHAAAITRRAAAKLMTKLPSTQAETQDEGIFCSVTALQPSLQHFDANY